MMINFEPLLCRESFQISHIQITLDHLTILPPLLILPVGLEFGGVKVSKSTCFSGIFPIFRGYFAVGTKAGHSAQAFVTSSLSHDYGEGIDLKNSIITLLGPQGMENNRTDIWNAFWIPQLW